MDKIENKIMKNLQDKIEQKMLAKYSEKASGNNTTSVAKENNT